MVTACDFSVVLPRAVRPSHSEQERIVTVLNMVDSHIVSGSSQLRKLRSLKPALMQDLLTGKRRVTPLLEAEAVQ
jgi:type I restriction enzyme S subunit